MVQIFSVLYNDESGNLNRQDVLKECKAEGWYPITVLKDRNDSSITVPLFREHDVAHNFMRRNIARENCLGLFQLVEEDVEAFRERGWTIKFLDYPNKFTSHPKYELGFEIYESNEEVDSQGYS